MATFLAIYSKHKQLANPKLNEVIKDFTGNRSVVTTQLQGFLLLVATQFSKFICKTDTTISFVSGHISLKDVGENPNDSIANLFDKWMLNANEKVIETSEGAYVAFQYNSQLHQLIYTNDKFGIMPLFAFEDNNYTVLSNEYQPLAQLNSSLNKSAIAEFLTLGITLGNKTFFKYINNLEPASFVKTTSKSTVAKQYWQANTQPALNTDELVKKMHNLFTEINQEYINAKVSELCLLTAGADSRLILATLTKEQLSTTKFYTSNLSFLEPTEDKDVIGATMLSEKFNLQHQIEKISFYENKFDETYFDKERELRTKQLYGGWHGGEFLGGYCLRFAPLPNELNYTDVHEKYKSIFNWKYRLKVKQHPYQSYKNELKKLNRNAFLFMIHQMTRSFFSNIYGGTRGHWVQPFQLMNHGFSPFWDSRFLQLLMQIPLEELKDYNFYNKILSLCEKEFTQIPSNSNLTNRTDSIIPKLETGIEPKHQIPNTHHEAYKDYLSDTKVWKRNFYNTKSLKKILENEFDSTTKQWLDFEVWYSKYIK